MNVSDCDSYSDLLILFQSKILGYFYSGAAYAEHHNFLNYLGGYPSGLSQGGYDQGFIERIGTIGRYQSMFRVYIKPYGGYKYAECYLTATRDSQKVYRTNWDVVQYNNVELGVAE